MSAVIVEWPMENDGKSFEPLSPDEVEAQLQKKMTDSFAGDVDLDPDAFEFALAVLFDESNRRVIRHRTACGSEVVAAMRSTAEGAGLAWLVDNGFLAGAS